MGIFKSCRLKDIPYIAESDTRSDWTETNVHITDSDGHIDVI